MLIYIFSYHSDCYTNFIFYDANYYVIDYICCYFDFFSPFYCQPERISGGSYDYKSDIWSLGLVILECAIGRFPYIPTEQEEGWLSFYELLEAIVEQPPPTAPPDQFSPEFCSFISAWYVHCSSMQQFYYNMCHFISPAFYLCFSYIIIKLLKFLSFCF